MAEIYFQASLIWGLPILLGALGAAWWLYRSRGDFSRPQRWLLASLRFLLLFFLALLLLRPFLRNISEERSAPLLLWLEDRSLSMATQTDTAAFSAWREEVWKALQPDYRLRAFAFAEDLVDWQDSLSGGLSNPGQALRALQGRYYRQNLAGLVLVSDGIANRGPSIASVDLNDLPVHVVALGDTQRYRDLRIERLVYNEQNPAGKAWPLEVHLRAERASGREGRLRIYQGEKQLLVERNITFSGNRDYRVEKFRLPASGLGLQNYRVELSKLEQEQNVRNNRQDFAVEMIEREYRLALLAGAPHPDLAPLQQALSRESEWTINLHLQETPAKPAAIDAYILHRPTEEQLALALGSQRPFWLISEDAAVLRTAGLPVQPRSLEREKIQAWPSAGFSLFNLSPQFPALLEDLPPVEVAYARWPEDLSGESLLRQKLGSVKTSRVLLHYFPRLQGRRAVFFAATGLWRWELELARQEKGREGLAELWRQSAAFLLRDANEQRLELSYSQSFAPGETPQLTARLRNLSGELTVEGQMNLELRREGQAPQSYRFEAERESYRLAIPALAGGRYSFTVRATLGEEKLERAGQFQVGEEELELRDLRARHAELAALAERHAGSFNAWPVAPGAVAEGISKSSEAADRIVTRYQNEEIIGLRWLFFVFLLLLTAEWVLRKIWGQY